MSPHAAFNLLIASLFIGVAVIVLAIAVSLAIVIIGATRKAVAGQVRK